MPSKAPNQQARPFDAVVLMGVCGCGKTTVGQRLAERNGWLFVDSDDYHPRSNIEKLRSGAPLDDADREPWYAILAELLRERAGDAVVVLACSALKETYRQWLGKSGRRIVYALLTGSEEALRQRLESRKDHFMPASLLKSQLATLEEPAAALKVSVEQPPEAIVAAIEERLADQPPTRTPEAADA